MLCDSSNCTACGACLTICPINCISFQYDECGYSYPVKDLSRCVDCGMCEKACPVLTPFVHMSVPSLSAIGTFDSFMNKYIILHELFKLFPILFYPLQVSLV